MSKELKTPFISGATVYAVILNAAGQAWRTDSGVFELPLVGDWAHYANAAMEQSTTGIYEGDFPAAITTAGAYHVLFRQQSGSSPASTDQSNGMLGGTIYWTGTAESFPLASNAASAASVAMSGSNVNVNITQVAGQTASAAASVAFPASIGTSTFASGGNVNVTQWNGTAVSLNGGLPSVNAGNVGAGGGPIAINHNTGGTDNLRYVDSNGNGVEGAQVLIYLATNWPSQPDLVQAAAATGPDGGWLSPAYVQSGTYVAVFTKIGADGPDVSSAFSV
ncbi:MAG: hypothetical protein ABSB74_06790 [Tepidisphaeraceae bacterium]